MKLQKIQFKKPTNKLRTSLQLDLQATLTPVVVNQPLINDDPLIENVTKSHSNNFKTLNSEASSKIKRMHLSQERVNTRTLGNIIKKYIFD